MRTSVTTDTVCHYCGDPCLEDKIVVKGNNYCCYGCATLDDVVAKINMSEEDVKLEYKQFDIQENFDQLIEFKNDKVYKVQIVLPSIHCSSCIELLEDLPSFNADVLSSHVNFEQKRASIVAKRTFKLSLLAQLLDEIGYPPQLSVSNKQKEVAKKQERIALFKMAVAGFCFGNIMLYSMPHYFGLELANDLFFSRLFSILSVVMSIPVVLYSGMEYLRSAYKAVAANKTHINIPIAIGMLSLWAWSLYEIFSGIGSGYLDSLAGLVFFLLVGKWFQSRIYDQVSFQRNLTEFIPMVVRQRTNEGVIWNQISSLNVGDEILVKNNEVIPVQAQLGSDHTLIDYSFITGEQAPEEVLQGADVFTGGRVLGGEAILKIEKKPDVNELWSNWQVGTKRELPLNWTNRISKHFTLAVLAIAAVTGIVWYFIDPSQIPFVCSAVLIVACPCALALSAPFTYGNILRVFSKNNFFVKDADSIQSLADIDLVVFDKTGTLTRSSKGMVNYQGEPLDATVKQAVYSACKQSTHPLSLRIADLLNEDEIEIKNFKELTSKGIEAEFNSSFLRIGSMPWLGKDSEDLESTVGIELDGEFLGYFSFQSVYRDGIEEVVESLSSEYKLNVISGDNDGEYEHLKALLPEGSELQFKLDPKQKEELITNWSNDKNVAMIGDGLNDSNALMSSSFGVAITESLNGFYPGADGVLIADEFSKLPRLMELAKYSKRILKIGLVFSLFYNLIGVSFAVAGLLTPIIAAVLMPISSITVVSLDSILVRMKAKKIGLL